MIAFKKALTLDGGGILGLIQARTLSRLESLSGKPLYQMFDLIAGTSTGAILACCAATGMPMSQIETFYLEDGPEIFRHRTLLEDVDPLGLLQARYYPGPIESALKRRLGNIMLSAAKVPIICPAFALNPPHDVIYSSSGVVKTPSNDVPLWKVARASSAAPTYFPPFEGMVDGGVFANNPAPCALAEMFKYGIEHSSIKMLSIGTGVKTKAIVLKNSGLTGWAPFISSVFMESGADSADFETRMVLGPNYLRINPPLDGCSDAIDDTSKEHMDAMLAVAEKSVADNLAALKEWAGGGLS